MVAHSEILLSKCAQFREQGEFIDVRLKAGEDLFPTHRIVLAANSDYFRAMFAHGMKESNHEVIELKDENISAAALKIVMDSIYSGELHVDDEIVFEVLLAADHLQVTSVVQQCCDYLLTEFVQLRFDVKMYCRICTIADRHNLMDLQEATQRKMAHMYKEICESDEFLSHMDADQLSRLLSRDDLSAPSESFVFKSVMQWIRYKKEERMAVAAKVVGAVRLGLVDITEVVRELNTEELQLVPEIHMLVYESLLHNCVPSSASKFALEKAKLRSGAPALVAVLPKTHLSYFDVENKVWKPLTPTFEAGSCYCVESVGSKLFIAGYWDCFCYDIERNVWEKLPHPGGTIKNLCTVGDYMYATKANCNDIPHRYSFAKHQWHSFAKVKICHNSSNNFYYIGATVLGSKVYVLYGHRAKVGFPDSSWLLQNAVLHCFDPVGNAWEGKASTCQPHFGSSLFVVNRRIHVAGGRVCVDDSDRPCGKPAPVEIYDEENNMWSIVEQKHIPENKLNAVEVEGKVFFIINKFPVESGIRIPPGEVYPVYLNEWQNLSKISDKALLCYMPVKRENLETEKG